jgi:hypothetical protein
MKIHRNHDQGESYAMNHLSSIALIALLLFLWRCTTCRPYSRITCRTGDACISLTLWYTHPLAILAAGESTCAKERCCCGALRLSDVSATQGHGQENPMSAAKARGTIGKIAKTKLLVWRLVTDLAPIEN